MANAKEDQPTQAAQSRRSRDPNAGDSRAAIGAVTKDVENFADKLPDYGKDASKRSADERDGEPIQVPAFLAAELAAVKERADNALNPPEEPPAQRIEIVPPQQAKQLTEGEILASVVHDVDQLARKVAEQGLGLNHNVSAAIVTELAAIRDRGVETMQKSADKSAERAARA